MKGVRALTRGAAPRRVRAATDRRTRTLTGTAASRRRFCTRAGRGTAPHTEHVPPGARVRAGLGRFLHDRRVKARRTRGRRLRRALIALLVLVLTLVGAGVVAYRLTVIPEPHPETAMQSTVFLDTRGDYLGRRGPVDRQAVPLAQVPRHVQEAVIAAENRSFRTDTGISPTAIARAAWSTVSGGGRQGGSTITQQYVKNALLSPQQSLSRKAREALIAIKLDRTRSKDEILEGYLNTVYFGRGAAGIQAAARNYFGVDAARLSVGQGAALAAVVNIPSYYEKAGSDAAVTAKLTHRWEWVLDAMADSGAITPADRAAARFPAFRFYPPGATDGQRQYLIDAAAAEAADRLGVTQDELARGGYTVRTTFDLTAQDAAAEPAAGPAAAEGTRLHSAVVALVPGDGAVRVLYGGADYARQPFNDALAGAVEAGTAMEPFTRAELGPPLAALPKRAAPSPLALSAAYATAAAGGRYAEPYTVQKISRDGRTLYAARPHTRTAMDPFSAQLVTKLLYSASGPRGAFTGGAGTRTLWRTTYDTKLSTTVALFAQHPAHGRHPARTAQLPSTAAELAADIVAGVMNRLDPVAAWPVRGPGPTSGG